MDTNTYRGTLKESLLKTVEQQSSLSAAYPQIEYLLLQAFDVKRVSIFQRRSHFRDLIARYKTGYEHLEIKVPISTKSIAGFVAMTQQPLIVNDPNNENELQQIHSKLRFEKKYDRAYKFKTESIICVPIICGGVLLGVLQLLNSNNGKFADADLVLALDIGEVLGQVFQYHLGGVPRPFDFLILNGLVEADVFENVSKDANKRFIVQNLQNEYDLTPLQIGEALSVYYQVPYVKYSPNRFTSNNKKNGLSKKYLQHQLACILTDAHEVTHVLMFEPDDGALLSELENSLAGEEYQLGFSMPSDILQFLEQYADDTPLAVEFDNIIDEITQEKTVQHFEKVEEVTPPQKEDEPAIVRLVTSILSEAARIGASDIHIDPEVDSATIVRMRVDGIMKDVKEIQASNHSTIVSRIKIMSGLNITEKRLPQDGKFAFNNEKEKVEVRVATVPTVAGESVVMRILSSGSALSLEQLALSEKNLMMCKDLVNQQHGIFLVVGATGSGKTTSLHAILSYLNTPDKKIWTAEDPVEITQHRLKQVQINQKIGFTFATALRAFLRADPDIILIGEMRDQETAFSAIEASLTGHLVLSTLHTNSATETITRLFDMGIDPINFSDACLGVLSQRLVRQLCPHCKEEYHASEQEIEYIRRQYNEEYCHELPINDSIILSKSIGCQKCNDEGYKGRIAVHELMPMTEAVRSLVNKHENIRQIKRQAMQDGMRTLAQDGILKLLEGEIDIKQILSL